VLELSGVKSALLNGSMTQRQRVAAVSLFENDRAVNVLIMSSVGSTGLNMPWATAIIALVSKHPHNH
jgi:superfamily II DNA/RNA helicase